MPSEPSGAPKNPSMNAKAGAKAIEKNSAVSSSEPGREALSGGTSQNRFLSRENTAMSNSCPTRNAVAEAIAIRGVDRNADRHSATAKPAITTVRARVGPSKRLVRSETRNANG
jgi:hypothetical protein